MSTYVRTLKEKTTDDTVYPVTKAGAVYMEDEESTVEDEISTLNSKYTFQNVTFTGGSVDAASRKTVSFSVAKTGYNAIGVMGVSFDSTEVLNIGKFYVSSNNAYIVVYNTFNAAREANGFATVLYEKA